MFAEKIKQNIHNILFLILVVTGLFVRIYFFVGHVFSDDAYYFKLSQFISENISLSEYQGYPIFKLRVIFNLLQALMLKIFGVSEISTIILPLIISILNLFLSYFFTKTFFNNKRTALIALLLIAFFPVEIVFSTISFPDSLNVFLINLGLYSLYKAYQSNKILPTLLAGLFFSISLLTKENVIIYLVIILFMMFLIVLKERKISSVFLTVLLIMILFFLIEGFIYKNMNNDFFYRINVLKENYKYSYYDFFPYSVQKVIHSDNYFLNLLFQIIINCKNVFIRRFYLFLPLLAFVIAILNIYKGREILISRFFLLLSLLFIAFTSDISSYRPLNLERSWYIFPLILPSALIVSHFLNRIRFKYLIVIFVIYLASSFIMSNSYLKYFNVDSNILIKNYIINKKEHKIYSDHFTKYSIDLLSGNDTTGVSFSNQTINKKFISKNSLVIYNKKHIDELILQGYNFDGLDTLIQNDLILVDSIGDFNIYKLRD
jgi:4-amino-4-deoxy-L-arabinose transferase-like glycosyltransferase